MARVALVTGGTRGIGCAISKALQHAGRTVIANYAGNDDAAAAFCGETGIRTMKFDAGDYDSCAKAIEIITAEIGPIEILVNNAGITRDTTMSRMTRDMWDAVIDTNLGSCFNLCKLTFVGAGHAIRRVAWAQAGGYDEALFFCWEEYDLSLRAIQAGWRIRYHGELCIRHKVASEGRIAWAGTRWFCFVRNRLYIARKWGIGWPALTPRIAAYLLKGLRNGLLAQTLLALWAAGRMPAAPEPMRLSPEANAYLASHDAAHRGSLPARLMQEVLSLLPGRR